MLKFNERIGTSGIIACTVLVIIVTVFLDGQYQWPDIDNQYTIIIEISVGGIIAFITFKRTGRDTAKITQLIARINQYEEKQEQFLGELERIRNARLGFYCTKLVTDFGVILNAFKFLEGLPETELLKLDNAYFDKFKIAHVVKVQVENRSADIPHLQYFIVMREDLRIVEPDLPPDISYLAGKTIELAQFSLVPIGGKIDTKNKLWELVKGDMQVAIDRLNSLIIDKKPLKEYGVHFYRNSADLKL